jgi:hypothetical protein
LQVISRNDTVTQNVFAEGKKSGKEFFMLNAIKVNLSRQEIIGAVKSMNKRDREDFLEELLASTSPEYLKSIKDARADYRAGRVKTHEEVFGY